MLLSENSAPAADKVKFGSPQPNTTIQTRPAATLEGLIPEKRDQFGSVNANAPTTTLPSTSTVVRSNSAGDNDDQDNWIFRDTQSARGIQRALGVEFYGDEPSKPGQSGSTTVVEDYFIRQSNYQAPQLTPNSTDPLDRLSSTAAPRGFSGTSSLGDSGFFAPTGAVPGGTLFGSDRGGFKNTLNSENPTTRSYYRDLYKEQISPSKPVIPALSPPIATEQPASSVSRTRQFYDRAAYIESLAPKGPASVFERNLEQAPQPAISQPEKSIYQVPIPERRGGRTVLPTRPF